jgi:phosphoribosyl 1,2-cyclic phosphodiesterase
MKSIEIIFWGVRGSIPTPGPSTIKYGGNTSCVSLQFQDGPFFILDAGSGIRELGKNLYHRNGNLTAYIFLSHFHWDHIQGLPFFRPAFIPGNNLIIYGSDDTVTELDQIISFQMNPTYFPIAIQDMQANLRFESIREDNLLIDNVKIETQYMNHPGYALGYRMTYQGKTVIYISDNEPFYSTRGNSDNNQQKNIKNLEELFDNFYENKDDKLIKFCRDADLLIHDTQFLPEEYEQKVTWGHSPSNFTVDLALQSKVKQLILFHHDPDHDDEQIDFIESVSQRQIKKMGGDLLCKAAKERMVINL